MTLRVHFGRKSQARWIRQCWGVVRLLRTRVGDVDRLRDSLERDGAHHLVQELNGGRWATGGVIAVVGVAVGAPAMVAMEFAEAGGVVADWGVRISAQLENLLKLRSATWWWAGNGTRVH